MSFLPNHDVTHSEKRRQQKEYHWALDNQMNAKLKKGVDRPEPLPSISQRHAAGGGPADGHGYADRQAYGGGRGMNGQAHAGIDPYQQQHSQASVEGASPSNREIDSIKQQFGALEQHVLTELNARKVAEKSFVIPQMELLSETVSSLQVELSESKQMNKTLFQMIKDLKAEDRMAEERIMSAHSAQLSEFDLVRADVRSLSAKVQSIVAGGAGLAPGKDMSGDIRLLESKLEAAIEDVKQQQVQQTDSVMAFFNGKMYQDLLKRLENTEKKCSIEVASLRMNSDIENDAVRLNINQLIATTEAEHKLLHANINGVVLEFNSLKAVTRSEIDETLSRLECIEKTWDNSVGDGLRSLHGDLSKGLASCQNQHEELKCVVSAEITARRKTDKKQLAALQALSDQLKRELSTMQQDIVNTANHSNSRTLSVENSISMVASSFTSQLSSLQDSTGQAVKMLREEISAKGIVNKSRVMGDSKSLKEVIEDVLKLSRRVEEFEYANNARATTITTEIADFMQNVAIKFEEVEDLVRREANNRDKEVRKLHTAVSGALIAQSQKISESSNHTMNKIRQATVAILEVMDRKLDDLEQRIAEKDRSHETVMRGSTQSAQSMLRPGILDSSKYAEGQDVQMSLESSIAQSVVSLDSGSVALGLSSSPQKPSMPKPSNEIELSVARLRNSFGVGSKAPSSTRQVVAVNDQLEKLSPRLGVKESPAIYTKDVDVSESVDSLITEPADQSVNRLVKIDSINFGAPSEPSMLDISKSSENEASDTSRRRPGFNVPPSGLGKEPSVISLRSDSGDDEPAPLSPAFHPTGSQGSLQSQEAASALEEIYSMPPSTVASAAALQPAASTASLAALSEQLQQDTSKASLISNLEKSLNSAGENEPNDMIVNSASPRRESNESVVQTSLSKNDIITVGSTNISVISASQQGIKAGISTTSIAYTEFGDSVHESSIPVNNQTMSELGPDNSISMVSLPTLTSKENGATPSLTSEPVVADDQLSKSHGDVIVQSNKTITAKLERTPSLPSTVKGSQAGLHLNASQGSLQSQAVASEISTMPPSTVASAAALHPAASTASLAAPSEPLQQDASKASLRSEAQQSVGVGRTASTPSLPSKTDGADVAPFSMPPSTVASTAALHPAVSTASLAAPSEPLQQDASKASLRSEAQQSVGVGRTASIPSLPPSTVASEAALQTVTSNASL